MIDPIRNIVLYSRVHESLKVYKDAVKLCSLFPVPTLEHLARAELRKAIIMAEANGIYYKE